MTKFIITDDAANAPLRITERSVAPTTANTGDIYLDDGTNTASTNAGFRRYNGTTWEDISAGAGGGGGATVALDNLASVQVNADIIPDTDNTYDLGSDAKRWQTVYSDILIGKQYRKVYNNSGVSIAAEKVVYQSGWNVANSLPEISLTNSGTTGAEEGAGITHTSIANGAIGTIITKGDAVYDTSGMAVNDELYIAATDGDLTNTRPSAIPILQEFAKIAKIGASPNGIIYVDYGDGVHLKATETYENKTIDGTLNTISNVDGADGTAIHDNTAAEISALTEKVTPVSGDHLIIEDSADSNNKKRIQVGNLPTGGGGEANTASNIGVGGVGFFDAKVGIDLQFRNAIAGSSKLTVTDVPANNEVAFDVAEANLTLDNLGGTLAITKGGTGAITAALARTALGLAIGSDIQAWSTALDAVTGTNTGDEVAASTTVAGISELATTAEVSTGTDTARTIPVSALPLQIQDSKYNYVLATGAVNTFAVSYTPTPSTYVTGQLFHFKANLANTGAVTLAVNGQAAKSIVKESSAALVANDIKLGALVTVMYDGTNFQMLSQLSNAPSGGGGGATLVSANKSYYQSSLLNTSSTTFVDTDATNHAVTLTLNGSGKTEVIFTFKAKKLTNGTASYRITDGTNNSHELTILATDISFVTLPYIFDALGAGSTTFKLQYKSSNANSAQIQIGSVVATAQEIS